MIKNILRQSREFIFISGIGFLLDFSIYYVLTNLIKIQISYANMISAIPAITYVFFISTRKIFESKKSKIKIKYKYTIYFLYQFFLVSLVSILAQKLYDFMIFIDFNYNFNYKIIIKCAITPITMCCNFIVMKILSEKI